MALCAVAAPLAATAASQPVPAPVEPAAASAQPRYSLRQLEALALASSPLLAVSQSDIAVARAAGITARAYPNPELDLGQGRSRARMPGAAAGSSSTFAIAQPLESPWLREARIRAAEGGLNLAERRASATRRDLAAAVRTAFFEVIRADEEIGAFREDLEITEQIRDRILVRVQAGEAPRFDLVRAEGEVEAARKNLTTARLRRLQLMAELRTFVGPALGGDFVLASDSDAQPTYQAADYAVLRTRLLERSTEVLVARAELTQAEQTVEVERNRVLPQVTLRAGWERAPDLNQSVVGATVTIPLLDRREGPIAEARARVERARLALSQREFEAQTAFDAAWQAFAAAQARVTGVEQGILARASAALEIAEAAYRLGERGILEFLDAQRQFRLARNELIAARYELRTTASEIERLVGREPINPSAPPKSS